MTVFKIWRFWHFSWIFVNSKCKHETVSVIFKHSGSLSIWLLRVKNPLGYGHEKIVWKWLWDSWKSWKRDDCLAKSWGAWKSTQKKMQLMTQWAHTETLMIAWVPLKLYLKQKKVEGMMLWIAALLTHTHVHSFPLPFKSDTNKTLIRFFKREISLSKMLVSAIKSVLLTFTLKLLKN